MSSGKDADGVDDDALDARVVNRQGELEFNAPLGVVQEHLRGSRAYRGGTWTTCSNTRNNRGGSKARRVGGTRPRGKEGTGDRRGRGCCSRRGGHSMNEGG